LELIKSGLLRLTGLFAQTACSAVWVPQNSSRAITPFVVFCSTTFFCVLEMLRISFIAHKKTSQITGTLGEIPLEIFCIFIWK
jgi:hypothetical protein